MSATGATRGDEDRGLVEEWLSAPLARGRYIAARFGTFAAACAIAITLASAAIGFTAVLSGFSLDLTEVVEESVALLALVLVCYGLAMALAQLASRRAAAAGLAGVVLAGLFFINSFGRTDASLRTIARVISPFYYLDRSMPLTPGGAFDGAATAGLLAAAVALAALAAWLMTLRDIGFPLLVLRGREHTVIHLPSHNPLLRISVVALLYEWRLGLLGWTVGATVGAAYMPTVGRSLVNLARQPGSFHGYLTLAGHGDPYVTLTGYVWFGILELALVALALTWISRWSSDDNEGRLEMQLSAPIPRWWVVCERSLAFLAAAGVIITISSVAFYLSARANNIHVHAAYLVVASLALLPFVLSFAAVGAVLTSRVPRAALAVLATIAFLSYLITEGGPLLKWPDWVMKLSAFALYDSPLTSGVYWTGMAILLAVTVVGFGGAAVLMERRDVGR
jgi:ABC-2 type transport system permease protein